MAHFAGTGPASETCRTCVFWAGNSVERAAMVPLAELTKLSIEERRQLGAHTGRRRWDKAGEPTPQACWKYRKMCRAKLNSDEMSPRVAHDTPACSHWAASPIPPQPLTKPQREAAQAASEG